MLRPDLLRRSLAEALAAFALVFAGCGAIVADARYEGALGVVGIALVFGLVIMVMVYAQLAGAIAGALVLLAIWPDGRVTSGRRCRVPGSAAHSSTRSC